MPLENALRKCPNTARSLVPTWSVWLERGAKGPEATMWTAIGLMHVLIGMYKEADLLKSHDSTSRMTAIWQRTVDRMCGKIQPVGS